MRCKLTENRPSEPLQLSDSDLGYLQTFKHARDILIIPCAEGKTYRLTADNVAGAIALPSGLQIHIQPKIGLPNLFRLLSFVSKDYFGIEDVVDYAEEDGIFDLLGQLFSKELTKVLKIGIRQDYDQLEGNLRTVRGRILFGQHLRLNTSQSGRVYCHFSRRSSNIIENQILLAAAETLLRGHVCNTDTQRALRASMRYIPAEVAAAGVSVQMLSTVQIGRHNRHYRRALFLAGLILRSVAFSNDLGPSRQPSFIINVAKLFEDYVAQCLTKYCDDPQLEIVAQESSPFDLEGVLNTQPDLVFKQRGTEDVISVADTKYKDVELRDVNSADAYQMLAYMINRNCQVSILIYPESIFRPAGQKETITIRSARGDYKIYVITVPLAEPKDTAASIRMTIENIRKERPSRVAV